MYMKLVLYILHSVLFSSRCCSRKPHSSSSLTFNCATGVEGYTH